MHAPAAELEEALPELVDQARAPHHKKLTPAQLTLHRMKAKQLKSRLDAARHEEPVVMGGGEAARRRAEASHHRRIKDLQHKLDMERTQLADGLALAAPD